MPHTVHVTGRSAAPPAAVYALLSDISTWSRWGPWVSTGLESPAPDGGQGVGAVRRLESRTLGRTIVSRERVVEATPDTRIRYALLSGLPLRDYVGAVDLAPDGSGGTTITWSSSFAPQRRGTGWFYRAVLRRFVTDLVPALARAAAERAPAA